MFPVLSGINVVQTGVLPSMSVIVNVVNVVSVPSRRPCRGRGGGGVEQFCHRVEKRENSAQSGVPSFWQRVRNRNKSELRKTSEESDGSQILDETALNLSLLLRF